MTRWMGTGSQLARTPRAAERKPSPDCVTTPNSTFPRMKSGATTSAGMIWIKKLCSVVKKPRLWFNEMIREKVCCKAVDATQEPGREPALATQGVIRHSLERGSGPSGSLPPDPTGGSSDRAAAGQDRSLPACQGRHT